MFFFDPMYLLFAAPGLLLGLWAQWRVRSTFSRYSNVGTRRGQTGAGVATEILRTEGIRGVAIERSHGRLSDHYSPLERTLRLSPDVYGGRSIAAAGIAAHEVGHAIQHARSYPFLGIRSALVPIVQFASPLAIPILFGGLILSSVSGGAFGSLLVLAGIGLFGMVVLFQLITLPVEFDASRRALLSLEAGGTLSSDELAGAREVLTAAAWTYVAAAVSSLLMLFYFLLRSGLVRSSD